MSRDQYGLPAEPLLAGEKVSTVVDGSRVWCVVRLALAGGRLLRLETPAGQRVWRSAT